MKALVGAIDQGTSSSRFLVFDPEAPESVVCQHQIEFDSSYPKDGWVDQDPNVLVDTVKEVREDLSDPLVWTWASREEDLVVLSLNRLALSPGLPVHQRSPLQAGGCRGLQNQGRGDHEPEGDNGGLGL